MSLLQSTLPIQMSPVHQVHQGDQMPRKTLYETFMEKTNMFQHVPSESSPVYRAMGFDRCMNDQMCRQLLELYERGYNKLFDELGRMMHGYHAWERLEQCNRFEVYLDATEPVFTRLAAMWEAEPETDDRLRFLRYTLGHRMNEDEETFLGQLILTPSVACGIVSHLECDTI